MTKSYMDGVEEIIAKCNVISSGIYLLYKHSDVIANDPTKLQALEQPLERIAYVVAQLSEVIEERQGETEESHFSLRP